MSHPRRLPHAGNITHLVDYNDTTMRQCLYSLRKLSMHPVDFRLDYSKTGEASRGDEETQKLGIDTMRGVSSCYEFGLGGCNVHPGVARALHWSSKYMKIYKSEFRDDDTQSAIRYTTHSSFTNTIACVQHETYFSLIDEMARELTGPITMFGRGSPASHISRTGGFKFARLLDKISELRATRNGRAVNALLSNMSTNKDNKFQGMCWMYIIPLMPLLSQSVLDVITPVWDQFYETVRAEVDASPPSSVFRRWASEHVLPYKDCIKTIVRLKNRIAVKGAVVSGIVEFYNKNFDKLHPLQRMGVISVILLDRRYEDVDEPSIVYMINASIEPSGWKQVVGSDIVQMVLMRVKPRELWKNPYKTMIDTVSRFKRAIRPEMCTAIRVSMLATVVCRMLESEARARNVDKRGLGKKLETFFMNIAENAVVLTENEITVDDRLLQVLAFRLDKVAAGVDDAAVVARRLLHVFTCNAQYEYVKELYRALKSRSMKNTHTRNHLCAEIEESMPCGLMKSYLKRWEDIPQKRAKGQHQL